MKPQQPPDAEPRKSLGAAIVQALAAGIVVAPPREIELKRRVKAAAQLLADYEEHPDGGWAELVEKLSSALSTCHLCRGMGQVTHTESWGGFEGSWPETCPVCKGTGKHDPR
jgi:hypothetical protein